MIKVTYHVEFDFKDREASDLEKLNRMLSFLKLKKLELKEPRGYLAVTRDGEGNLVHQRYGFDSGILTGTPAKDGNCYQIDTVVTDSSVTHDDLLEIWRSTHYDRVVRTVITVDYTESLAYIILHHEKV